MAGAVREYDSSNAAAYCGLARCGGGNATALRQAAALLIWLLAAAFLVPPALAREPRLALVIGNSAYQGFDRLAATATDGDRMASALSGAGFNDATGDGAVTAHRDLTREQMLALLDQFAAKLKAAGPDAFGVLYFSGHGAALGTFGDVMLLPVDADHTLSIEATSLTRAAIARKLLGSGAKNLLIVLDMCRNVLKEPPLPTTPSDLAAPDPAGVSGFDGTKGLRRIVRQSDLLVRPDQGYLIAYSTSPDQVAFDNGTFSRILAEEIRRPQQDIAEALKRTSDRVAMSAIQSQGKFQKPTFDYGLQGAPPCFISCGAAGEGRFLDCANCPYMRILPAGLASIGSPASEPKRGSDEPVQSEQRIEHAFAISTYEVTIAEWDACVRDQACHPISGWSKDNPNPLIPATGLAYPDALAFTAWLSAQTGQHYRLPNGAEWEYADRAGAATPFPWGDAISPSDANYDQTASYRGSATAPYRGYPEAVNAYPPNAFGLYQMNGNAWELTADCADKGCTAHTARGGSFQSAPEELRAANRFAVADGKRRSDMGLRVVRDISADESMQ